MAARATDGRCSKPGQRVEVRVEAEQIVVRRLPVDSPTGTALDLARHQRATERGTLVVEPAHWAELPDGHTRATTVETSRPSSEVPAVEDRMLEAIAREGAAAVTAPVGAGGAADSAARRRQLS